jgi:hypothetical protein
MTLAGSLLSFRRLRLSQAQTLDSITSAHHSSGVSTFGGVRVLGKPPPHLSQKELPNKPAGKCPNGPRYKALGNSMAVPVMRWIGERIKKCG